jgi:uncharacterized integral membrane protein
MRQTYFIGGLILGVVITIFAIQNPLTVEVRFLFWQSEGPLAAVVLLSAAAGLVVAVLFAIPEVLGARWRIRTLERRLGDLQARDTRPPEERPEDLPRVS